MKTRPNHCGGYDEYATDKDGKPYMRAAYVRRWPTGYLEKYGGKVNVSISGVLQFANGDKWVPSTCCPFTAAEGDTKCVHCRQMQTKENDRASAQFIGINQTPQQAKNERKKR